MKKVLTVLSAVLALAIMIPAQADASCICTKIYKPVCARKGKISKTYGNACAAKCAGAKVCAQGPCRCPVYRLAKPAPGCKYIWRLKGCCRVPKLICKKARPFCTKENCKVCNNKCLARKKRCVSRARRFGYKDVAKVRKACSKAGYRSKHKCLCSWAMRRAPENVILNGMRGCLLKKCKRFKCCKAGRKLCIPNPPNVQCVRAPCCQKMVCAPKRCK